MQGRAPRCVLDGKIGTLLNERIHDGIATDGRCMHDSRHTTDVSYRCVNTQAILGAQDTEDLSDLVSVDVPNDIAHFL